MAPCILGVVGPGMGRLSRVSIVANFLPRYFSICRRISQKHCGQGSTLESSSQGHRNRNPDREQRSEQPLSSDFASAVSTLLLFVHVTIRES